MGKFQLYHKIDNGPSEILKTSVSKLLDLGTLLASLSVSLAHTQVLIVLLSLLCTLTVLLEYTKLQLGCIVYYCYLHACMQSSMIIASLACLTLLPLVYQGVELKVGGCVKVGKCLTEVA